MIVDKERIRLASTNFLFKGISNADLKSLIKPKNFYTVEEGKIIYSSGDDASEIYLIVEGEVKIKFSGTRKVERKCVLDFFGEDEILKNSGVFHLMDGQASLQEKRLSSAIANKNAILYKISFEELKLLMESMPALKNNLYKEENIVQEEYKNFIQPGYQQDADFDFTDDVIDTNELIS